LTWKKGRIQDGERLRDTNKLRGRGRGKQRAPEGGPMRCFIFLQKKSFEKNIRKTLENHYFFIFWLENYDFA
jgi:hypothetical protein